MEFHISHWNPIVTLELKFESFYSRLYFCEPEEGKRDGSTLFVKNDWQIEISMGNPWTPSLMSEDTTNPLDFTGVSTTSNTTTTTTHSPPKQSTSQQLEAATCYQPRLITSVGFSNSPSTNLTSSCWKQVMSEGWKSGPLATFWEKKFKQVSFQQTRN